jgi:hypothetical protein
VIEIVGEITEVETIAAGPGVQVRRRLDRVYGQGRWRKLKGRATVRLPDGTMCEAEVHWFEAHGIGRRDGKVKRVIRWIGS